MLYEEPLLYDLAFGWSSELEVDFYERVFREYAGGVERVLELGCGTGRLMVEFARRGFLVDGIDLSPAMAKYAKAKFRRLGLWRAEVFVGDMSKFCTTRRYDGALCALNTFSHLLTPEQARSHMLCVAGALRRGGVYCVDLSPAGSGRPRVHKWTNEVLGVVAYCKWMREGGKGLVRESYEFLFLWPDGSARVLNGSMTMRAWTVDEFLRLVDSVEELELVACYEGFDRKGPVEPSESLNRLIAVLRRL